MNDLRANNSNTEIKSDTGAKPSVIVDEIEIIELEERLELDSRCNICKPS